MKKRIGKFGKNFNFVDSLYKFGLCPKTPPSSCTEFPSKVNQNSKFFQNKKGIISEYLPWLLISIAILVILMFAVFMLKDKGIGIIDKLQGLFRKG